MEDKDKTVEEAEEVTDNEKGKKGNSKIKGLNFLFVGKYFLILLVAIAQIFLAFTIIDNNYEKIYEFVSNFSEENNGSYQFEELIVNPAGTNGQRFLVVEISVELADIEHIELVEDNKQKIKHHMNEILSSRTVDQLIQFEEREKLRSELIEIINNAIGLSSVRDLYYTKYVMQ